jgi:hypothetical protein
MDPAQEQPGPVILDRCKSTFAYHEILVFEGSLFFRQPLLIDLHMQPQG